MFGRTQNRIEEYNPTIQLQGVLLWLTRYCELGRHGCVAASGCSAGNGAASAKFCTSSSELWRPDCSRNLQHIQTPAAHIAAYFSPKFYPAIVFAHLNWGHLHKPSFRNELLARLPSPAPFCRGLPSLMQSERRSFAQNWILM